jgi:hypothetical protein
MSELSDHIKIQKILHDYAMKYGMKSYLNLLNGSVVDLSYYNFNKTQDIALKEIYILLNDYKVRFE